MNVPLVPGIYLLDKKIQVNVIKPSTRSNSTYIVEIQGKSIESIDRDRLTSISMDVERIVQ